MPTYAYIDVEANSEEEAMAKAEKEFRPRDAFIENGGENCSAHGFSSISANKK